MTINSISEYYDTISSLLASELKQGNTSSVSDTDEDENRDSYISTISSSSEAIPCENYNDILKVMSKSNSENASLESETEETEETGVSGAGGSGSSGSDEEEEVTTELVTINGVTYLETTITSGDMTTTTRTVISGEEEE